MRKKPELTSDVEIMGLLEEKETEKVIYRVGDRVHKLRAWRKVYLYTASAIILSVMLIFACEFLNLTDLGNNIIDFFTDIDFIGGDTHGNTNEEPLPDNVQPPNIEQENDKDNVKDEGNNGSQTPPGESTDVGTVVKDIYDFDISLVPDGHIPIVPMDLSLSQYGSCYINNSTGYTPNVSELLSKKLEDFLGSGVNLLTENKMPKVLIVHTHGTESYSPEGAISCPEENVGMRSSDITQNVVGLGKIIADTLNSAGIPTAHCTVMHDSIQYKDSYARAEEAIRAYIKKYPSIELVIDIHRDAIMRSSGEIIRPVAQHEDEVLSQAMILVGSDWNGQACPGWENNLSLALKLRSLLNSKCYNLCRPVNLKGNTYNQELAKYSLLIEIGASGNSLAEAQRSAEFIAECLVELINKK